MCFAVFPCDLYLAVTTTIDAGGPAPAISVRSKARRLINLCPKSLPKRLTAVVGPRPVYTPARAEPFSLDNRPAKHAGVDARELCGSYAYSHDRTPNAVFGQARRGVSAPVEPHIFYNFSHFQANPSSLIPTSRTCLLLHGRGIAPLRERCWINLLSAIDGKFSDFIRSDALGCSGHQTSGKYSSSLPAQPGPASRHHHRATLLPVQGTRGGPTAVTCLHRTS